MIDVIDILSPNLDNLLLESIAEGKLDTTLIPDQLHGKVLKLIQGKYDITRFKLTEKMCLLSSLGINTYILTVKKDKESGIRVAKDLLESMKHNFQHRQIASLQKLSKNDTVVISDKDLIRFMESMYFIQNKTSIMNMVKDLSDVKTSRLNNAYFSKQKEDKVIDDCTKFIANAKLVETKILIESKLNRQQYTIMMALYLNGVMLLTELFKMVEGSAKKKYDDVRELESRRLVQFEKLENKKTVTAIITSPGKQLIFNLVKKHF